MSSGLLSGNRLRTLAGYTAIASSLPYLALKMVWLGGGTLGVADTAMMRDVSMVVLNVLTAGMDLAGIGLALAFTHQWGLRLPAWLLLPPIWVATGLLARFIVAVPIVALIGRVTPAAVPRVTGGPVEPWVYAVVYTEFVGMGLALIVAFCLYARVRWTAQLDTPAPVSQQAPTGSLQVALANTMTVTSALLGALFLVWAFGATYGLTAAAAARRTMIGSLIDGIDGALMVAGGVGIQLMIRDRSVGWRSWLAVAVTWLGSGSMFGWGLWQTANVLGQSALLRGAEWQPLINLLGLARLIVGLSLGLLMLFVLAERGSGAARAHPRQGTEGEKMVASISR